MGDLMWIKSNGTFVDMGENAQLFRGGRPPESFMIIVDGLLGMEPAPGSSNGGPIELGPGDVVGETPLLEGNSPPTVVKALCRTKVITVPYAVLKKKMHSDPAFGARFYKALAASISNRLASRRLPPHTPRVAEPDQLSTREAHVRTRLAALVGDFKRAMYAAETDALENGNVVPPERARRTFEYFRQFIHLLGRELSDADPELVDGLAPTLQQEILPYVLLTTTAERLYSKPRGYPMDYDMLEIIYRNEPDGRGRIGPLLDWCFLNVEPMHAARYRKNLMRDEILRCVTTSRKPRVRVTAVSPGPADEVFEAYAVLREPAKLKTTIIDYDPVALSRLGRRIEELGLEDHLRLVKFQQGGDLEPLDPQDMIYCTTLPDYLTDTALLRLVDSAHELLCNGGKLYISSLHRRNPARMFMECVLEWRPRHRVQKDLDTLFMSSRFASTPEKIKLDTRAVCMVAVVTKSSRSGAVS